VIFRPIDALNILCAKLTRDLFAIAKFLFIYVTTYNNFTQSICLHIWVRCQRECARRFRLRVLINVHYLGVGLRLVISKMAHRYSFIVIIGSRPHSGCVIRLTLSRVLPPVRRNMVRLIGSFLILSTAEIVQHFTASHTLTTIAVDVSWIFSEEATCWSPLIRKRYVEYICKSDEQIVVATTKKEKCLAVRRRSSVYQEGSDARG